MAIPLPSALGTTGATSAVSALSKWKLVNSPGQSVPQGKDMDPDSEPGTGGHRNQWVPVLCGREARNLGAREEPASAESPSSPEFYEMKLEGSTGPTCFWRLEREDVSPS